MSRADVERTLLVHWQEHCSECAPPTCYEVCPIYVERADKKCARFVYGIYPAPRIAGLLDRGADIRFRRWAKIETSLSGKSVTVRAHRCLDRLDARLTSGTNAIAGALESLDPRHRLNSGLTISRNRLFRVIGKGPGAYHDFVLECFSADEEPFRLILEYERDGETRLRHSFEIRSGHNFHTLPASRFGTLEGARKTRLRLYAEEDAERRVIFSWLDFVRYAPGRGNTAMAAPAEKVKCVAWDLDNTLWQGTLIEDGLAGCRARPKALELIKALDDRGIIQTVVSKNDHDEAWPLVVALGLEDYFLYPAINWGQKSESLLQIAERLNIGIDSFAVIDDSPFERSEIGAALPMVRTYPIEHLGELLERPELDVPITTMSKTRRLSYLAQVQRERVQEAHGGDYESFLDSCEMRMRVFVPKEDAQRRRCLELVQRTNQLNLSARRYSAEQFEGVLATRGLLCIALDCRDRFGHYGIVGFASVDERGSIPRVLDFVMSCRVFQKRVEHAFFVWLATRERARGMSALEAELVRTPRNGPLRRALEGLPFATFAATEEGALITMALDEIDEPSGVVRIEVELDDA